MGEVEPEAVTDDTHIGLKVTITLEGVAELVLRTSPLEDYRAETLSKKLCYVDKKIEWKVTLHMMRWCIPWNGFHYVQLATLVSVNDPQAFRVLFFVRTTSFGLFRGVRRICRCRT